MQDRHIGDVRVTRIEEQMGPGFPAKDFFPEFVRATNVVMDRYAAKDAFFKEVLDSQRKFGQVVVPYWTKILDLYSNLGNAAIDSGAVGK